MEFLAQGIGGGSQDPVVERSTSRIVHLLSVYDPTGYTARQPHGYCMGERGLVRSWCGFREVGCQQCLAGELCERERGRTNLGADAPTAIPAYSGWPSRQRSKRDE